MGHYQVLKDPGLFHLFTGPSCVLSSLSFLIHKGGRQAARPIAVRTK